MGTPQHVPRNTPLPPAAADQISCELRCLQEQESRKGEPHVGGQRMYRREGSLRVTSPVVSRIDHKRVADPRKLTETDVRCPTSRHGILLTDETDLLPSRYAVPPYDITPAEILKVRKLEGHGILVRYSENLSTAVDDSYTRSRSTYSFKSHSHSPHRRPHRNHPPHPDLILAIAPFQSSAHRHKGNCRRHPTGHLPATPPSYTLIPLTPDCGNQTADCLRAVPRPLAVRCRVVRLVLQSDQNIASLWLHSGVGGGHRRESRRKVQQRCRTVRRCAPNSFRRLLQAG